MSSMSRNPAHSEPFPPNCRMLPHRENLLIQVNLNSFPDMLHPEFLGTASGSTPGNLSDAYRLSRRGVRHESLQFWQ